MPFSRDKFGLFFSLPLGPSDWRNLALSKVKRVQLQAAFATDEELARLQDSGVANIAVRVGNSDLGSPSDRSRTRDAVAHMVTNNMGVDTVILGVEPENGLSMGYGSDTWGQGVAFQNAYNVRMMLDALRPVPIKTVSPGWTARGHYRDWREGLQPGELAWLEITRIAYDRCDLNGCHWYGGDGTFYDVMERMRLDLWLEQTRRHRPLYIDELGVGRGTAIERMAAYLRIATLLLETDRSKPYGGAGERVEALVPFVSSGNAQGWSSGYLIRDPDAYRMVGQFMDGVSFLF